MGEISHTKGQKLSQATVITVLQGKLTAIKVSPWDTACTWNEAVYGTNILICMSYLWMKVPFTKT